MLLSHTAMFRSLFFAVLSVLVVSPVTSFAQLAPLAPQATITILKPVAGDTLRPNWYAQIHGQYTGELSYPIYWEYTIDSGAIWKSIAVDKGTSGMKPDLHWASWD